MNTYLGVKGTDGKVLRDVTDSAGLPTTLTGRKAVKTILANAVQIRDTTNHYFPGNIGTYGSSLTMQDVSDYAEKGVIVYNGHDQAVSITVHADVSQNPANTQGNFTVVTTESLAAGARKWFGSGAYPQLKEPFPYLAVLITSAVVPTTGAVTITLQGGQR